MNIINLNNMNEQSSAFLLYYSLMKRLSIVLQQYQYYCTEDRASRVSLQNNYTAYEKNELKIYPTALYCKVVAK